MSNLKKAQRVEIRVTEFEKAAWAEAAGGVRRVSEWLRSLANAAAAATPKVEEPAAEVEPRAVVKQPGRAQVKAQAFTKQTPAKCPRWMHHRPGTYCGSCKKSF